MVSDNHLKDIKMIVDAMLYVIGILGGFAGGFYCAMRYVESLNERD